MKKVYLGMLVSLMLVGFSGCAQKAVDIKPAYISPIKYERYSCNQLGDEISRINQRVLTISGQQDRTANKDMIVGTVGAVVFWPALLLLATGDDQKEEIARLKGEYNAVRSVAIKKKCKWSEDIPKQ